MKLYEILKGSEYSLDLFNQDAIIELENRIIERTDKKGKVLIYKVTVKRRKLLRLWLF